MINSTRMQPLTRSKLKVRTGPSGVHIFDRTTGLNVFFDEVLLPQALWAAAPRQVSIALTNACDFTCSYCYAPKNHGTLKAEQVAIWLNELDVNGCLSVGFGGGEPTLYRHLVELCRYAAQETMLSVSFTTHAYRLDEVLIAKLAGSVHFVRISMDGLGATYEALRGRSFSILRRRLEIVRTLAPFGINYVVNSHTLPDLDAATALAAELGASEFLLLPEQPVRGSGGIDAHTFRELRRWVTYYHGPVPLVVSEAGAEGMPTCNPVTNETGLSAYAHIDANGILKQSSYDCEGVAIGAGGVMQALDVLRARCRRGSL